jgi:hypothetical protein
MKFKIRRHLDDSLHTFISPKFHDQRYELELNNHDSDGLEKNSEHYCNILNPLFKRNFNFNHNSYTFLLNSYEL